MSFNIILNVDRVVNEIKRGGIIKLTSKQYLSSIEFITPAFFSMLQAMGERLELLLAVENTIISLDVTGIGFASLESIYLDVRKAQGAKREDDLAKAVIELMKIGELLPAALIFTFNKEIENCLSLPLEEIESYPKIRRENLHIATRAKLNLREVEQEAEIIGFRNLTGGVEHYAIIVGPVKPDEALIRIHSSCYTGDLLGSLSCDCYDQLHHALKVMGEEKNGGILLYLWQEGRAIGLMNKLRTYKLQQEGLDTVEANQALGFRDDERDFTVAASMLTLLDIKSVYVLTNNPRKAEELKKYGIEVRGIKSHLVETNHTKHLDYLKTKSEKMGHILPTELFNKEEK